MHGHDRILEKVERACDRDLCDQSNRVLDECMRVSLWDRIVDGNNNGSHDEMSTAKPRMTTGKERGLHPQRIQRSIMDERLYMMNPQDDCDCFLEVPQRHLRGVRLQMFAV